MVHLGVIEPSSGPFASPVVPVLMPDGSTRFYCDFRRLNSSTIPDGFSMARIDDLIDNRGKIDTSYCFRYAPWPISEAIYGLRSS